MPVLAASVPSDRGVEREREGGVRFAFRHFPLVDIHPHAFAAASAAEAASVQGRFWEMHDVLFRRQKALEGDNLQRYASELDLDLDRFDQDRLSSQRRRALRRARQP
jgi:protein-disulfide isomerase